MGLLRIQVAVDALTAYSREVVRGVSRYGRQAGNWSISIYPRQDLYENLRHEVCAGRVVQATSLQHAEQLRGDRVPLVNVGDAIRFTDLVCVMSDHREIGRTGAEHFLARGFKNLGFVGSTGHWYAQQRCEGFRDMARSAHVEVAEYWEVPGVGTAEDRRRWLRGLKRPAAVMGCHDGVAREVVEDCLNAELRVPEDVAVLGVDNDEMICELGDPPISSVAIAAQRIGFEAAKLLDDLINGRKLAKTTVVIPPLSVVTRRSTDVLATNDPCVTRAVQYIGAHAGDQITVSDVARALGVSRRQLEQRFVAALGRTPASEIRRTQVERVKNLLETTDAPLSQIASACGLSDGPSLSRFFHRETGQTPSDYRNRLRVGR